MANVRAHGCFLHHGLSELTSEDVPLIARVSSTRGPVCRCQVWQYSRSVSSAE
jgi:hypothetical protein